MTTYQTKAMLSCNIGALQHDKRSHQKKPALTKINGAHLLKWLAASCMLKCVGAAAVSGPAAPCHHTRGCAWSPHFVKPRHTVWHNGLSLSLSLSLAQRHLAISVCVSLSLPLSRAATPLR